MKAMLQILFLVGVSIGATATACDVCRDCLEGKPHAPGYRHPANVKVPTKKNTAEKAEIKNDRGPASIEKPEPRPGA